MSETRKQPETFAEQAKRLGISISTLKARIKREADEKKVKKSERDLFDKGPGWNPRAGNTKRN